MDSTTQIELEVVLYIGALLHMDLANFNDGLNYPSDGLISIFHDLQPLHPPGWLMFESPSIGCILIMEQTLLQDLFLP